MRGNGSQLASYLLNTADNDNVIVFDIRGTCWPNDLRKSLLEMSLTSELTKSDKGLYHVQICPAYGEDRRMTPENWFRAAEILEEETGFLEQKRVMVLQEKNNRLHMHIAYERYDHEKGIMKSDSFLRLAQDRARVRMEIEFEHHRTATRNKHRPALKEELTQLWQKTTTAQDFLKAVEQKGYAIAIGTQRPYMVVDHTGTSFDLVRQLEGIRTKQVQERFQKTKLVKEKEAIQAVRSRQAAEKLNKAQEQAIDKIMLQQEQVKIKEEYLAANDNDRNKAVANNNDKPKTSTHSMTTSFKIDQSKSAQQSKEAIDKIERTRIEKEKIVEELKQASIKRAKMFRDNERDM